MTSTSYDSNGDSTGYELVIYRISRECNAVLGTDTPRGPMLFIHGFASDASDWWNVSDPTQDHIGMQYAKDGYDVYYANLRGSAPSRGHGDRRFNSEGTNQ